MRNVIEMKVDTVGSMSKTGAKCVLKGEKEINGVSTKFSLTVACDGVDLFEDMDIGDEESVIDMVLQDSAQQSLFDKDEVDVEINEA